MFNKIKRQANCTCLPFYGGDEGIRKEWNDGIASETNLFVKTSVSTQGFECDIVAHAKGVPLVDGKRKNGLTCPFCSFGGDEGIRTPGLCVANASLYQLSHTPKVVSA